MVGCNLCLLWFMVSVFIVVHGLCAYFLVHGLYVFFGSWALYLLWIVGSVFILVHGFLAYSGSWFLCFVWFGRAVVTRGLWSAVIGVCDLYWIRVIICTGWGLWFILVVGS